MLPLLGWIEMALYKLNQPFSFYRPDERQGAPRTHWYRKPAKMPNQIPTLTSSPLLNRATVLPHKLKQHNNDEFVWNKLVCLFDFSFLDTSIWLGLESLCFFKVYFMCMAL